MAMICGREFRIGASYAAARPQEGGRWPRQLVAIVDAHTVRFSLPTGTLIECGNGE